MKSKKQLVRDGMIAFLQNAEEEYKKRKTTTSRKIKVKATDMWEFINERFPQIAETKYRPSTLKSIWTRINSKFNNKFEMNYDIKQGPIPKGKSQRKVSSILDEPKDTILSVEPAATEKPAESIEPLTEFCIMEAKADVEHDPLWSTFSAFEPCIYDVDTSSSTEDDFTTIDSFDKFLEDVNSSTSNETNLFKTFSEVCDTPQYTQSIDDIFAFLMDEEHLQ